jgi:hypothetical protein
MYAHVGSQKKSATDLAAIESVSAFDVYPNPYEEKLTISYNLNKTGKITIEMFDVSGKLYKTILKSTKQESGLKTISLEGAESGIFPGIYYVRVSADGSAFTKKVVKIK